MAKGSKVKQHKSDALADGGMSSVRAIDRAIDILNAFTSEQPTMSVLEIQKRVGLSRPTLYRLLHTMTQRGLIRAEGDPQRFKLGHAVMHLAHVWLRGLDVVGLARPVLEELRKKTGETAALFVLQEQRGICVHECPSHHVLAITRGIGHSVEITQGATGKAILSALSSERKAEFFERVQKHLRPQLSETVDMARRDGYAVSKGEIIVGAIAVAAPYFDHSGQVYGSVGLYGPNARVHQAQLEQFAKLVVDAAERISALLGHAIDNKTSKIQNAAKTLHHTTRPVSKRR